MKPTILAAFVVAATTISLPASAQPPRAVVQLTLDEAISRGLDASHRLGELKARRDAADATSGSRHAAMLPQVAAQAGYVRTNHVDEFGLLLPTGQLKVIYPDIPDNVRSRLDMQWPIYTGGRVDALERAARAETSAAETDIATARLDLRLEITRAYWALVTANESIRVVDQSLARVDAHLRDVRNRLEQGLVPPNEVLTLEAQRARQQMLAVQARAVRDNAETDLGRLTGVEPGTGLDPQSALTPPAVPSENATALVATAHGNRTERAGLTSRVEAANARVLAAAAGRKPVIAIGGGVDFARPNTRIFPRSGDWNESWDASINLNWPIFDGGRTKAEVAEATAGRRAIEERLADFDVNVAAEVRQRLTDLTASTAAIAAAGEAVKAAAEARRVVADRYAAGVATNTEVVDAQVAQLQAELDRTQSIASARLAEARLARALGR